MIFRALAYITTNGKYMSFSNPVFDAIGYGNLLGVPIMMWIMLLVFITIGFVWIFIGKRYLAAGRLQQHLPFQPRIQTDFWCAACQFHPAGSWRRKIESHPDEPESAIKKMRILRPGARQGRRRKNSNREKRRLEFLFVA